jgi:hypothetical protein
LFSAISSDGAATTDLSGHVDCWLFIDLSSDRARVWQKSCEKEKEELSRWLAHSNHSDHPSHSISLARSYINSVSPSHQFLTLSLTPVRPVSVRPRRRHPPVRSINSQSDLFLNLSLALSLSLLVNSLSLLARSRATQRALLPAQHCHQLFPRATFSPIFKLFLNSLGW